ncbi:hypothetical protein EDD21DRAFT_216300 [Dissophora ornata]|nr:hypothetical protein EDD21DRAFT_216300 [Dissophora ornata]
MPRIPLNVAVSLPHKLGPPPKSLPKIFKPTDAEARSLFRQLWRMGSLSVMYTNPGRQVIRQKIREGFEESKRLSDEDPRRLRRQWKLALNTKYFLEIASTRFGVEHSVISNLTRITAENSKGSTRTQKLNIRNAQKEADEEYNAVIRALNDSMGLSLR